MVRMKVLTLPIGHVVVLQRRLAVARCQLEQPTLDPKVRRLWRSPSKLRASADEGTAHAREGSIVRHTSPLICPFAFRQSEGAQIDGCAVQLSPTIAPPDQVPLRLVLASSCPVRWPTGGLWRVPVLFCCGGDSVVALLNVCRWQEKAPGEPRTRRGLCRLMSNGKAISSSGNLWRGSWPLLFLFIPRREAAGHYSRALDRDEYIRWVADPAVC